MSVDYSSESRDYLMRVSKEITTHAKPCRQTYERVRGMSEERELLNKLDAIQDEIWRLKEVERDTRSGLEMLEREKQKKFLELLDKKEKIV